MSQVSQISQVSKVSKVSKVAVLYLTKLGWYQKPIWLRLREGHFTRCCPLSNETPEMASIRDRHF